MSQPHPAHPGVQHNVLNIKQLKECVRGARGQRRTRRKFSAEFKRDAVELVLSGGKSVAEAARDLGIYDLTLGNWVKQARIDRGQQKGLSTEERARLKDLEQENAKLRMARDLLTRAHEPCGCGSRPSDPLPLC